MNVNAVSLSSQYAPTQKYQAVATTQISKADNDGDYDKGTGQDDIVQKKVLQVAAQPHIGSNINILA